MKMRFGVNKANNKNNVIVLYLMFKNAISNHLIEYKIHTNTVNTNRHSSVFLPIYADSFTLL